MSAHNFIFFLPYCLAFMIFLIAFSYFVARMVSRGVVERENQLIREMRRK